MIPKLRKFLYFQSLILLTLCLTLSFSGCDSIINKIESLRMRYASPDEKLAKARQDFQESKYEKVIQEIKDISNQKPELQEEAALLLSRSYARIGSVDQALENISILLKIDPTKAVELTNDSALEIIQHDKRFLNLVHVNVQKSQLPPKNQKNNLNIINDSKMSESSVESSKNKNSLNKIELNSKDQHVYFKELTENLNTEEETKNLLLLIQDDLNGKEINTQNEALNLLKKHLN
jgi:hypothetical protein